MGMCLPSQHPVPVPTATELNQYRLLRCDVRRLTRMSELVGRCTLAHVQEADLTGCSLPNYTTKLSTHDESLMCCLGLSLSVAELNWMGSECLFPRADISSLHPP